MTKIPADILAAIPPASAMVAERRRTSLAEAGRAKVAGLWDDRLVPPGSEHWACLPPIT